MLSCKKGVIENMKELIKSLKSYLNEALSISVNVHPWKNPDNIPFFLIDSYEFYKFSILEQSCLLMVPKEDIEITPGLVGKHYNQVQKNCNDWIIYAQSSLSSYNRKRLIEHGIPFIIPGNQMYLPQLGIDLREHFRKLQSKEHKPFSPAAQAVIIYALVRQTNEKLTSSLLAEKLGYTLMTINRIFVELKAVQVGEFFQEGRERWWTFSNKQALWKKTAPLLRSPVKKRIWLKNNQPKIIAGLTALSHFSSLAPPLLPVFATSTYQWETWKKLGLKELPSTDGADVELEIWYYNPTFFATNGFVDPFSLYLSLKSSQDERIESALKELMEKIEW